MPATAKFWGRAYCGKLSANTALPVPSLRQPKSQGDTLRERGTLRSGLRMTKVQFLPVSSITAIDIIGIRFDF